MSRALFVLWTVTPSVYPRPWRSCSRCGEPRPFRCSGKFRLNANGKRLDAWLVYKCLACDGTWNHSVIERRAACDIPPTLLAAFEINDGALVRRFAFLPAHFGVMPDPSNFARHEHLARAYAHAATLMAILKKLAPETVNAASEIIRSWYLDDQSKQDIIDAADHPAWRDVPTSKIEDHLAEQLGQRVTNDLMERYEAKWAALGIQWKITSPRDLTAIAEQFSSMLQAVLVDVAHLDLLLVPSSVEIDIERSASTSWTLEQKADNGSLIWRLSISKEQEEEVSRGKFEGEHESIQCLAAVASVFSQLSVLPEADFLPLIETRMKGLMTRAFWVRPAAELMTEARYMALGDQAVNMPSLSSKQREMTPLCADELAWRSNLPKQYTTEKAQEAIETRYRRMMPFANKVVPLAMADARVRGLLTKLHDEGMLDWQILSILLNICLTQRAERRVGPVFRGQEDRLIEIQRDELKKLEAGDDPELDLSTIDDQTIEMHRKTQVLAVLKTWGMLTRRITPNFDALKRLLDVRFRHTDDDVAHQDVFGWSDARAA